MKKKKIIWGVVLLLAGFLGAYGAYRFYPETKIEPGKIQNSGRKNVSPAMTTRTSVKTITEWYEAVGTVRPTTETRIESQVTAQVKTVRVKSGDKVAKNQVLVLLDDRQFLSRLDQAKQGLERVVATKKQARQSVIAAEAAFVQAGSAYKRTKTYFESQAATTQDLENSQAIFLQAKAALSRTKEALAGSDASIRQAKEVIRESEIARGYTKIRAPETGKVLKRLIEPGDLALPGKPLIILQTKAALRLEAYVREGMIQKVKPGEKLRVYIQTLDKTTDAIVEEIVPYADPQTRTFLVKVALPDIPGLYPGMYGKLLIPIQEHQVVLIPLKAVRKVGQLELVRVKANGVWETRFVKTGQKIDDTVEILSGLEANEIIGMEE